MQRAKLSGSHGGFDDAEQRPEPEDLPGFQIARRSEIHRLATLDKGCVHNSPAF
ncbi:hypothetical protein SDC9_174911 [bioreactor metagenome]|uniref:Uncharacterized protein n=1 Tax=bioreactor metagenome TaxID=1076179 RepID=A0A645GKR2_9ZZZZ